MNKALRSLSLLIAIILLSTSFGFAQKFNSPMEMVDMAKKSVKMITPEDFKKKVDGGDSTMVLIDVRDIQEFNSGKITNAINISRGTLEFKISQDVNRMKKRDLKKSDEIVLYCDNGDRSTLAAESLSKFGYTNITVLQGGLDAWIKAGNKLDRSRFRPDAMKGVNGPNSQSKDDIMKMRNDMMKKQQQQQQPSTPDNGVK